tara:strand:- start:589 stop:804 length:216 start_codon:yes stop_codon:yes gene_type:complete
MNKRLKQLMGQCYETGPIGRDGWPEYSNLNGEKFAQLIVEECAKRAEVYAYMSPNFNALAEELRKMIGVEE